MQQTVVTAQPQAPVAIVQPPRHSMNISAVRGLGIASIVIGAITFILGIVVVAVAKYHWAARSGAGIWCGAWIIITGILGVLSARSPNNGTLNGFNMAFNIITTIITFLDGIFFVVAVGYYGTCSIWSAYGNSYYYGCYKRNPYGYGYYYTYCKGYYYYTSGCKDRDEGLGLYSVLLICMVVEWFVALIAAIYCCSGACCTRQHTAGVIIQQPQPQMHVITSTAAGQQQIVSSGQPMMMTSGQPMMTNGQYPVMMQPVTSNMQPVNSTMQPTSTNFQPASSAYPSQQYAMGQGQPPTQAYSPMYGQTNVAYSGENPQAGQPMQHQPMQMQVKEGLPPPYYS